MRASPDWTESLLVATWGHSTIVITGKYYLHVGDDALRAAVERV